MIMREVDEDDDGDQLQHGEGPAALRQKGRASPHAGVGQVDEEIGKGEGPLSRVTQVHSGASQHPLHPRDPLDH